MSLHVRVYDTSTLALADKFVYSPVIVYCRDFSENKEDLVLIGDSELPENTIMEIKRNINNKIVLDRVFTLGQSTLGVDKI